MKARQEWRAADARRCVQCGLYRGLHQFPESLEGEPDDEYARWCLPCLRAESVIESSSSPGVPLSASGVNIGLERCQ